MRRFFPTIARFLLRDDGPTAIEYAFMLMLIIVVCLTAVALFGDATARTFRDSNEQIENAVSDASQPMGSMAPAVSVL